MNQLCMYCRNEINTIYTFYGKNFNPFNYISICLTDVKNSLKMI